MFGLNETARLYRREGQRGGKPVYTEQGLLFRCRTQPVAQRIAGGTALARAGEIKVFCEALPVAAGDRIVTQGGAGWIVKEVRVRRGLNTPHHLELLAAAEG